MFFSLRSKQWSFHIFTHHRAQYTSEPLNLIVSSLFNLITFSILNLAPSAAKKTDHNMRNTFVVLTIFDDVMTHSDYLTRVTLDSKTFARRIFISFIYLVSLDKK